MHRIWNEELGSSRRLKLTRKRRTKYDRLYQEHLSDTSRPLDAFRLILKRVQLSDHHMSERSYQMPESLFRNAERREQWIERTMELIGDDGRPVSPQERKRRRRVERMAREMERLERERSSDDA